MPTNFPAALDTLPRPSSSSPMNVAPYQGSLVIDNLSDAIEAIEAKLGVQSSLPAAGTVLRGGAGPVSAWGPIQTGDIASNAISIRPALAAGTTSPATTNTTVAALADPTVSITLAVTSDLLVWYTGVYNDNPGQALVNYSARVDSGSFVAGPQASQPSSAGRYFIAGLVMFAGVAAGAHTIQLGNSSSTSASTITHYAAGRFLLVLALAR